MFRTLALFLEIQFLRTSQNIWLMKAAMRRRHCLVLFQSLVLLLYNNCFIVQMLLSSLCMPSATVSVDVSIVGFSNADHYCVFCFSGQKLDDDKRDGIPEIFIDQDEVLAKVGN